MQSNLRAFQGKRSHLSKRTRPSPQGTRVTRLIPALRLRLTQPKRWHPAQTAPTLKRSQSAIPQKPPKATRLRLNRPPRARIGKFFNISGRQRRRRKMKSKAAIDLLTDPNEHIQTAKLPVPAATTSACAHKCLNFIVRSLSRKKTAILQLLPSMTTARLYKWAFQAFGVNRPEVLTLKEGNRPVPWSDTITIQEVFDLDGRGPALLLELCVPPLPGGMWSNGSDCDSDSDDHSQIASLDQISINNHQSRAQVAPAPVKKTPEEEFKENEDEQQLTEEQKKLVEQIESMLSPKQNKEKIEFDHETLLSAQNSPEVQQALNIKTRNKLNQLINFIPKLNTYEKIKQAERQKISNRPKLSLSKSVTVKDHREFSNVVQVTDTADKQIFAQSYQHKLQKNAKVYKLVPDSVSEKGRDRFYKPIETKLEAYEEGIDWVTKLVFFQYFPETNKFSTIKSFLIDNNVKKITERTLFADQDGTVFYVSGNEGEKLNFCNIGDDIPQQFELDKASHLYEYFNKGNAAYQQRVVGYNGYESCSLPLGQPTSMVIEGQRVVVFSRFVWGEKVSVCFYSVEQKREVLQCFGASMLITITPSQSTFDCLFYANSLLCSTLIQDEEDLQCLNSELKHHIENAKAIIKIPASKRKTIDLTKAMTSDEKVEIDLQDNYEQFKSRFANKSGEEIQLMLANQLSDQQHQPTLQENTHNFMRGGPITVIQSGIEDKKTAGIAIFNNNNVAILHSGTNQVIYQQTGEKVFQVHYSAAERSFQVMQFDVFTDKMKTFRIVSASDQPQNCLECALPRQHREYFENRYYELLGGMITATSWMEQVGLNERVSLCKAIETTPQYHQWSVKTLNHIMIFTNGGQIIFLAWEDTNTNEWQLVGIDISRVGRIYCLPDQASQTDEDQSLIPVVISGFLSDKLTQLQIRFPGLRLHDMAIKDVVLSATLHDYRERENKHQVPSAAIKHSVTLGTARLVRVTDSDITTATRNIFKSSRDQNLSCSLMSAAGQHFFAISHVDSKQSSINIHASYDDDKDPYEPKIMGQIYAPYTFSTKSTHVMKTDKIVKVQQCLQNEWKQSICGQKVAPELMVLNIEWLLVKLRFTPGDALDKSGKFEQLLSLDLEKFQGVPSLLQGIEDYESVTLTDNAITNNNKVFSFGQRQFYPLIEGQAVDKSQRINASNKMIIESHKEDDTLEISTVDNPSSRSANPLGFNFLGLRNAKHVIPIGPNSFLLQMKEMLKFDAYPDTDESCSEFKLYWSLLVGDKITRIDPTLEPILNEQKWTQVSASPPINGFYKLALYFVELTSKEDAAEQIRSTCEQIRKDPTAELANNANTSKEDCKELMRLEKIHEEIGRSAMANRKPQYQIGVRSLIPAFDAPTPGAKEQKEYYASKIKPFRGQIIEDSRRIKLDTRKVKVLELSNQGEMLSEKEVETQANELSIKQESIFVNYSDEVVCVQVFYHEQASKEPAIFKQDSENQVKTLSIPVYRRVSLCSWAYVNAKVFWTFEESNPTIRIFDLMTKKEQSTFNISKYLLDPLNIGFISLKACLPHQMIRINSRSSIDEENLSKLGNHLQVACNELVGVFDCSDEKPRMDKQMTGLEEQSNPERYVESGYAAISSNHATEHEQTIKTILEPNTSGTIILEKNLGTEQPMGLYKTYSYLQLCVFDSMIRNETLEDLFDKSVLFCRFGQQTVTEILSEDPRKLQQLQPMIEKFNFSEEESKDTFSEDSIRFANSFMVNTHITYGQDEDNLEFSSFMHQHITDTATRDVAISISNQSPAFNMMQVVKNLDNLDDLLQTGTNLSNEELNTCFQPNTFTRRVKSLEWPENLTNLTIVNREPVISESMCKEAIEKGGYNKKTRTVKRTVRASMIDLRWLFVNKKNVIAFTQVLDDLPNKVYSSSMLQKVLDQYWQTMQKMIFYWHCLPFCVLAIFSIYYFTSLLKDKQDSEDESDSIMVQKLLLTVLICPLWMYQIYSEYKQIRKLGCAYLKSIWNWVDTISMALTAFVIFNSYETLQFIQMSSVRVFASVASMMIILKVFDWLRLFEATAYIILLVKHTLIDIGYFMIVILFALLMFGFPMVILNQNRSSEESELVSDQTGNWLMDILVNQYLLALGEFASLDAFAEGSQAVMCYLYFILATFMVQIVMFNMLIAIMGDTFDKITENRAINAIKSKLELLADLKGVLNTEDSEQNEEIFLFNVEPDNDDSNDDTDEWHGSINQITQIFKKSITDLAEKNQAQTKELKGQINDSQEMQDSKNEKNVKVIQEQVKDVKEQVKDVAITIETKMGALEAKIEFMFSELFTQLADKIHSQSQEENQNQDF